KRGKIEPCFRLGVQRYQRLQRNADEALVERAFAELAEGHVGESGEGAELKSAVEAPRDFEGHAVIAGQVATSVNIEVEAVVARFVIEAGVTDQHVIVAQTKQPIEFPLPDL